MCVFGIVDWISRESVSVVRDKKWGHLMAPFRFHIIDPFSFSGSNKRMTEGASRAA